MTVPGILTTLRSLTDRVVRLAYGVEVTLLWMLWLCEPAMGVYTASTLVPQFTSPNAQNQTPSGSFGWSRWMFYELLLRVSEDGCPKCGTRRRGRPAS